MLIACLTSPWFWGLVFCNIQFVQQGNLLKRIYVLILHSRLNHLVSLLSISIFKIQSDLIEHLLNNWSNSNRTEISLLRKSAPGNRLSLSNMLWNFADPLKTAWTFPSLFSFKTPWWDMLFDISQLLFASSILNWSAWPKVMFSTTNHDRALQSPWGTFFLMFLNNL